MVTLMTLAMIAFSGLGVGNSFECETDEVSLCASKEDKTCVNKKVACSGNFLCEDKTDLDWCKKKERKEETCPRHYKRCSTETTTTTDGLPGQCIWYSKLGDKSYSCSDRSDENPFSLALPPLDFSLVKSCRARGGENGLMCDESENLCIKISDWCQRDNSKLCPSLGGRYTNDPHLCRNKTFWEMNDKSCPLPHLRCHGQNAGRCVQYADWGDEQLGCDSGLDRYQKINNHDPRMTEKQTNSWELPEFLPNHLEPISASQCAEEGRIQCKVRGVDMCLDKKSRCDGHPQCDVKNKGDEPDDEKNCSSDQLRQSLEDDLKNNPEMSFVCQSPFYNPDLVRVSTLATRCDAVPECWAKVDEKNCNSLIARLGILGETTSSIFKN